MARASLGVYEFECAPGGDLILLASNAAADRLTGIDGAAMRGRKAGEVFPGPVGNAVEEALTHAAESGDAVDGVELRCQVDGCDRAFEVSAFSVGAGRLGCLFRDISERVRAEDALRHLVAASSAVDGPDFLRQLTRSLAQALSADAAFVGVVVPEAPHQMSTLAMTMDGSLTEGVVFDVAASPVSEALTRGIFWVPCGLAVRYPDDLLAQISQCEAFVGVALRGRDGKALGVLGALYCHAVEDADSVGAVLQVMSARVAGEIERLRVVEALRASEQRFRAFVQNSTDITTVLDYGGIVTFESPSASRLLGYEPGELIGKNCLELIHPDDLPAVQSRLVDLAQRRGNGKPVEVRIRHRDGRWVHLEIMGENLLTNPTVRGFLLTARDISERRRAEEALRITERRFRTYFESPLVGAVIWLPDGRCAEANERMCQMLGYTRDEMSEMTWRDLTHGEDQIADARALEAAQRGELTAYMREKRYKRKDGSIVAALVSSRCVLGADGKLDHIVSVSEDLDQRRRAEGDLLASEERHRQLVQASNDWVWEVDTHAVYTYSSDHASEFLGYESGEVIGKTPFDLMPPDEAARMAALLGPLAERREPFRGLMNVSRCKDGRLVTLVTNGVPFHDRFGEFAGYRGVSRPAA